GPSASNRFFHEYKVCLDNPTRAAKSLAGKPLRRHVSKSSKRCSADSTGTLTCSGFTKRRPRGLAVRPGTGPPPRNAGAQPGSCVGAFSGAVPSGSPHGGPTAQSGQESAASATGGSPPGEDGSPPLGSGTGGSAASVAGAPRLTGSGRRLG